MHELAHILLIEDNEDDYEAMRRSFVKSRFVNPLTWCRNAEDALGMLRRDESHADKAPPRPGLILLDLNMPGMDGRRFLEIVKADERLKSIPVVVLTTSSDTADIERCYRLGASTYIPKPVTFDGLIEAVRALRDYWFSIALRPAHPSADPSNALKAPRRRTAARCHVIRLYRRCGERLAHRRRFAWVIKGPERDARSMKSRPKPVTPG